VKVLEPINAHNSSVFMKMTEKKKLNRTQKINYDMQIIDYSTNWASDIIKDHNKHYSIMMLFSLTRLMHKPETMMENLTKVFDNEGSIIIFFIDGDEVERLLGSSERFEITDETNKPIVGVYKYDDIETKNGNVGQIVVYVREILRFRFGVVESVLYNKDIVNLFKSNGYYVVDTKTLDEHLMDKVSQQTDLSDIAMKSTKQTLKLIRCTVFKRSTMTSK
jgi:hypothetical protein